MINLALKQCDSYMVTPVGIRDNQVNFNLDRTSEKPLKMLKPATVLS
jgi:hypothetical protein